MISLSKTPRLDEVMASGRVGPLVTREQVAGAVHTTVAHVSSPDLLDVLEALGLVPAGSSPRIACGTLRGYHRHEELGETSCLECRKSWNAYHSRLKRQGGGSR